MLRRGADLLPLPGLTPISQPSCPLNSRYTDRQLNSGQFLVLILFVMSLYLSVFNY
jgi:hypothetical protein